MRLTPAQLQPLLLTRGEQQIWNYIVDIPAEWGPGGESPSAEGQLFSCERCKTPYIVRSLDHEPTIARACDYHWGKPLYRLIEGASPFTSVYPLYQHQCLQANVREATYVVRPQLTTVTPMAAHADHTSFTRVIPLNFMRDIHSPRVHL